MYNQYGKPQKQYSFAQQTKTPADKKERFQEHPEFKSSIRLSKDGKWIVHKLTITTFKPVGFLHQEGAA